MSKKILVCAADAASRLERALAWLGERRRDERVLIVAASAEAAADLARDAVSRGGAGFGWERITLGRLAATLAAPELAARRLAPVGALPMEALCARVVHQLAQTGGLGRFAAVADRPGLPRALARSLEELRKAGVIPGELADGDVARVQRALESEMETAGLADRALVLRLALERTRAGPHPLLGLPLLLLDLPLAGALERELVGALAERSHDVLATAPAGDEGALAVALGVPAVRVDAPAASSLARIQSTLFSGVSGAAAELDDGVAILSAPGEGRECVELVRLARREAERGVPFDRMAILLRAPGQYRALVQEALERAGIPAYYARGTVMPDPAGRAFLALLGCAAEDLSARRFAEYLSLGEVPEPEPDGAPPPPAPPNDRWVAPDEEMVKSRAEVRGDDGPWEVSTLRAPRRWERLLVEAAVIGGRERWARRLAGLRHGLELDRAELERAGDPAAERARRDLSELERLRRYALPLVDTLAALPRQATWGEWLEQLSALATRALRRPERVLSVLAELAPMAPIGPVALPEVRLVLGRRLTEVALPPSGRRYGRIFVGPIEAARGMAFDAVFVPGLAERLFPQKVVEDAILRDDARRQLGRGLETNLERVAGERLALRLAVGAARARLVLSYPRLDLQQARPRVPSFYTLDVLSAAEGRLPGFDELARRAEIASGASIGWPAPANPSDAVDEAEHDLSLLDQILRRPPEETRGTARYLLSANEHLGRALRSRARRWLRRWTPADGLVDPAAEARAALAKHALDARSYSPTALQNFASCPYKFLLQAVHRLAPRQEPEAIEALDPMQYGSLVHDVQFELLGRLRDAALLPTTPANLDQARAALEEVLASVAARYHDDLAPAIERVWEDGVASVKADLREWLRRAAEDPRWTPWRFELSFGLGDRRGRDPASVEEPVPLDCGIRLRGSIDLVERAGDALRATDHKTGKVRAEEGAVIGGGATLQPVLYALAVEKLFPGSRVESGRLYYCTAASDFQDVVIPLDEAARRGAQAVAATIGAALGRGFLPAAPAERACEFCDYRAICGPHEEQRVKFKSQAELAPLLALREMK